MLQLKLENISEREAVLKINSLFNYQDSSNYSKQSIWNLQAGYTQLLLYCTNSLFQLNSKKSFFEEIIDG